jgi:hypothetical protein
MNHFIERLKAIKNRPGMYFPDNELIEATNFIAGMDLMQENPINEDFRKWLLKNKLRSRSSVYWPKLVALYMENKKIDHEQQVEEFLNLIFEFLEANESNIDK